MFKTKFTEKFRNFDNGVAEDFVRIYLNIDDNVDLYEVYISDKEDKLNRLKRLILQALFHEKIFKTTK